MKAINKIIDKFDHFQLWWMSALILRLVKKSKYKKHKYDIALDILKWYIMISTLFFFVCLPVICVIINYMTDAYISIMVGAFNAILSGGFGYIMNRHDIEVYRVFYDQRKNPMVYEAARLATEESWEEDKKWRRKEIKMMFVFFIVHASIYTPYFFMDDIKKFNINVLFFINVWIYNLFIGSINRYLRYIFDFDPPDKKKKKKKEALTKVILDGWKRLLDSMKPMPNPSPI